MNRQKRHVLSHITIKKSDSLHIGKPFKSIPCILKSRLMLPIYATQNCRINQIKKFIQKTRCFHLMPPRNRRRFLQRLINHTVPLGQANQVSQLLLRSIGVQIEMQSCILRTVWWFYANSKTGV